MSSTSDSTLAPAPKPLILIVDDVAANVHVLAAELRTHYRIKVALNGPSGRARGPAKSSTSRRRIARMTRGT